jgi:hypothetical protein
MPNFLFSLPLILWPPVILRIRSHCGAETVLLMNYDSVRRPGIAALTRAIGRHAAHEPGSSPIHGHHPVEGDYCDPLVLNALAKAYATAARPTPQIPSADYQRQFDVLTSRVTLPQTWRRGRRKR